MSFMGVSMFRSGCTYQSWRTKADARNTVFSGHQVLISVRARRTERLFVSIGKISKDFSNGLWYWYYRFWILPLESLSLHFSLTLLASHSNYPLNLKKTTSRGTVVASLKLTVRDCVKTVSVALNAKWGTRKRCSLPNNWCCWFSKVMPYRMARWTNIKGSGCFQIMNRWIYQN